MQMVNFSGSVGSVVDIVESVGVAILVIGGLLVVLHSLLLYLIPSHRSNAYRYFRLHLGRTVLLGLEVLIVADIVRTVIVDQSAISIAVLATIVAIRIVLSWTLAVEIDGVWPWRKAEAE